MGLCLASDTHRRPRRAYECRRGRQEVTPRSERTQFRPHDGPCTAFTVVAAKADFRAVVCAMASKRVRHDTYPRLIRCGLHLLGWWDTACLWGQEIRIGSRCRLFIFVDQSTEAVSADDPPSAPALEALHSAVAGPVPGVAAPHGSRSWSARSCAGIAISSGAGGRSSPAAPDADALV